MTGIRFHRRVAGFGTALGVREGVDRNATNGRQGKRLALWAAQVVGWIRDFAHSITAPCWRSRHLLQGFQRAERRRCPFQPSSRP
jgi:hypothetical protein